MLRVGLTGGIGSGKSAVSQRLAGHGAVVIDADLLAREVVQPGTAGLAEVVAAFGTGVLAPDGTLSRPALGRRVFGDVEARRRLETVVHPLVRARAAELEAAAAPDAVVVHDIPLLVETGQQGDFDVVVVVDAPDEARLARLVSVRGMDADEAWTRLAAQASRHERLAAADEVVDNSGTLSALDRQAADLWRRLEARAERKT
ncbi:MAG: dephospho-CoA kinase [Nocardioidaceae bacterium]|nr:dephospho-CoA kinase [Nocardioidaceae bacterium]